MGRTLVLTVTKGDFRVDTFRAGGPGGQNQNKRESGVRITHIESGFVGESREHKSQLQNKNAAFDRLSHNPKFQDWLKRKAGEVSFDVWATAAENNARLERGKKIQEIDKEIARLRKQIMEESCVDQESTK